MCGRACRGASARGSSARHLYATTLSIVQCALYLLAEFIFCIVDVTALDVLKIFLTSLVIKCLCATMFDDGFVVLYFVRENWKMVTSTLV